jgi:AhpD family alkylhydroperoxidase
MPRLPYTKLSAKPYEAMVAVGHALSISTALETKLLELVKLRASQLNGCEFCVGMHTAEMKRHNEPQSLINAIPKYQTSDAFTPRERAALAWTDAVTNIQAGHASDEAYAAVSEFFQGKDLVDLTFAVAQINAWNRLGIAFAVEWNPPQGRVAETSIK